MSGEHPVVTELARVQYDLTALKARVAEIQRQVAAAELPGLAEHVCEVCGVRARSAARLAEHRYVSHEGPVPEHYRAAEALAEA